MEASTCVSIYAGIAERLIDERSNGCVVYSDAEQGLLRVDTPNSSSIAWYGVEFCDDSDSVLLLVEYKSSLKRYLIRVSGYQPIVDLVEAASVGRQIQGLKDVFKSDIPADDAWFEALDKKFLRLPVVAAQEKNKIWDAWNQRPVKGAIV